MHFDAKEKENGSKHFLFLKKLSNKHKDNDNKEKLLSIFGKKNKKVKYW